MTADQAKEMVFQAIFKRLRRNPAGAINPSTAIKAIRSQCDPEPAIADIFLGLGQLAQEGYVSGVAVNPDSGEGRVIGQIRWICPKDVYPSDPRLEYWRSTVAAFSFTDSLAAVLLDPPQSVLKLNENDQIALADCIAKTVEQLDPEQNVPDYLVSGRMIMGGAKVFEKWPALATAIRGERTGQPLPALCYGPADPERVLVIENASVFHWLRDHTSQLSVLVVCGFGYGLTSKNLGQQIANGNVIAASIDGVNHPDFIGTLRTKPIVYWGDFDTEGFSIFSDFRKRLPQTKLSKIYRRMATAVKEHTESHPYNRLFDKSGERLRRRDDVDLQSWYDMSSQRAVDQEAFTRVDLINEIITAEE